MTVEEYRFLLSHLSCQICGGPFSLRFPSGQLRCPSHGIPKTCSKTCWGKLNYPNSRVAGFGVFKGDRRPESAIVRKERHGNWKGGVTPEESQLRNTIEYKAWRDAVYARDDYTCQDCGVKGGRLNAHHINQFVTHPELRLDVDNGLTLCRPCHKKRHKTYSKKPRYDY